MKKYLLILLTLLLLSFVLTGCRDDFSGSLSYQEEDCIFTGVCEMEDGSYTLEIQHHPDGSGEILFLAPQTLTGCRYLRTAKGEYSFVAEDLVFPVEANPTVETIFGLFALKESDLLSAKVTENSGEELNVLTFAGDVTVYLSSQGGRPMRFEHPLLTLNIHKSSVGEQKSE